MLRLRCCPKRFRAPVSLRFGPPLNRLDADEIALRRFLEARVRALKAAADQDLANRR